MEKIFRFKYYIPQKYVCFFVFFYYQLGLRGVERVDIFYLGLLP